jgi:hypothetical protein
LLLIALRAIPIQGYDRASILSSAPGIPAVLNSSNNGNMSTTPLDVSTRTMRDVTEVIKKKARSDMNSIPDDKKGHDCLRLNTKNDWRIVTIQTHQASLISIQRLSFSHHNFQLGLLASPIFL